MAQSPDVVVNILSASSNRTDPSDTGRAFIVGSTQRGDNTQPIQCASLTDFTTRFGARQTASLMYDWADTFFSEGGTTLYVSRATGSGAVVATANALDGTSGVSLSIFAGSYGQKDPGVWGNSVSFAILTSADDAVGIPSGTFVVQVLYNSVEVERSYPCVTQDDAVNWARRNSAYVFIVKGVGTTPAHNATPTSLATGSDGSAVADADRQAALDRISQTFGPGQVCMPGITTSVAHLQLLAHALAKQRFALLDAPDTPTVATLISLAQADQAAPSSGQRWGQLLAPWDVVPGITATTLRTVPPSARLAAQYARVDAAGNPNQPAAGRFGQARYVGDLSQPAWDSATRGALNAAGVTVSRRMFPNVVQTYGERSLADAINDPQWSQASNVRTAMWIAAKARVAAGPHEFQDVDPQGQMLAGLKGDLMGSVMNPLFLAGALGAPGDSPADTFYIDVGPDVNTPQMLSQKKVGANIAFRPSSAPEVIVINVTNTPLTQALG